LTIARETLNETYSSEVNEVQVTVLLSHDMAKSIMLTNFNLLFSMQVST